MIQPVFAFPRSFARSASALVAATAFFLASTVQAQPSALVQGNGIAITPADMQADSQRMPPEMRDLVLSDVRKAGQIADNLYIRRALAQQAIDQGLNKDPETAAAARVATDKVFSDALIAKLDAKNAPTDAAVEAMARNIYRASPERFMNKEQVQVRHILLSKEGDSARADAEAVLKQLKDGADFATVAKEKSKDPGSAAKGGDLGTFEHGRMVPEFDTAAFALRKPGELSGLVESKFGYHIIQLEEYKPAARQTFEEAHDPLVQEVRGKVIQEARLAEVRKIQEGAKPNAAAIEAFSAGYKPVAPAAAGK